MLTASFAMTRLPVHPATRILLWLAYALALQHAEGVELLPLLALALLGLLPSGAWARWQRTVWRLRWLLLSLCLVFAFATPGEPLWGVEAAPTYQGLTAGSVHGARLLALLAAVTWLAVCTPADELMSGLYVLLSPLRRLGLPPERAVVRLLLTLEYVDALPERRGWRGFVEAAEMPQEEPAQAAGIDWVTLARPAWSWFDGALLLAVALVLLAWGVFG
jgi:energy-coupling factor transporter transmembrane protein EcfT